MNNGYEDILDSMGKDELESKNAYLEVGQIVSNALKQIDDKMPEELQLL